MSFRILVVDDEEGIRFTFMRFLDAAGYNTLTVESFQKAVRLVREESFDLIFTDILLDEKSGIEVLREVRKKNHFCPVVMITGHPDIETAFEAVRMGAYDYLPKPVRKETLLRVAKMALRHKALLEEKEIYRTSLEAVFSSVKDGLITVDENLTILEINPSVGGICDLHEDAVGQRLDARTLSCSGDCIKVLAQCLADQTGIEVARLHCERQDSPAQVVSLSVSPLIKPHGRFAGAVMAVRDETRLHDLERNLNERQKFHKIIGSSRKMQDVYTLMDDLAEVDTTVLITGDSGTGKELAAEALHTMGVRRSGPMVKVNCAALPDSLLESELFGHVKGAFTGAIKDKIGRFQMAHQGTLFLDEIGDISPHMQVRLLRVLQEREFERVGDGKPIRVDVRIIAATNQDLGEKVRNGSFREDLYYRLKVIELRLPPLRERREDIPVLARHFIERFNVKFQKNILRLAPEVHAALMAYPWPGNIRELENLVEHAFILCHQTTLSLEHLPEDFRANLANSAAPSPDNADEREGLQKALEKCAWNKAKAARMLGMSRQTLYRKIQLHGLTAPDHASF